MANLRKIRNIIKNGVQGPRTLGKKVYELYNSVLKSGGITVVSEPRFSQTFSLRHRDTSRTDTREFMCPASSGQPYSGTAYRFPIPTDCYCTRMSITTNIAPDNGAGVQSYKYDMIAQYDDNINNIMQGTISELEVTVDSENLQSFQPMGIFLPRGSIMLVVINPINTPTAHTELEFEYDLISTTPGEIILLHATADEGTFTALEAQIPFCNDIANSSDAAHTDFNLIWPVAGQFTKWILLRANPQVGASATTECRLKNINQATEIQLDQVNTPDYLNTSLGIFEYSGNPLSVAEGDVLQYDQTPINTPTANTTLQSFVFVPDNPQEMMYGSSTLDTYTASATEYLWPDLRGSTNGVTRRFTTVQDDRKVKWSRTETLSNFRVKLSGTPGGTGLIVKLKNLTAATEVQMTVPFDGTTTENTSNTLSVTAGDYVALEFNSDTGASTARSLRYFTYKGAVTGNAPVPSRIVISSMLGAVTDTGFKANFINIDDRSTVMVVSTVGTKAGFDGAIIGQTIAVNSETYQVVLGTDTTTRPFYVVEHEMTGLTADTQYYYALRDAATQIIDLDSISPIKTYYLDGAEVDSTVTDVYAFGGYLDSFDEVSFFTENRFFVLSKVLDESNVRMFLIPGDLGWHGSTSGTDLDVMKYLLPIRMNPEFANLARQVSVIHTFGDRDSGSDDNDNETTNAAIWRPVIYDTYRKLVPYHTFAAGSETWMQGVPRRFFDGRVMILVLDTQYQRHPTDGDMIGDGSVITTLNGGDPYTTFDQEGYIRLKLSEATENGCKLVLIMIGGHCLPSSSVESFNGSTYSAQWRRICDDICDNTKDYPEVVFLHGNHRNYGADDGSTAMLFTNSSGQCAFLRCNPVKGSSTQTATQGDTWDGVGENTTPADKQGIGILRVTKNPTSHEYTYDCDMFDNTNAAAQLDISKSDQTRNVDFDVRTTSEQFHPGIGNTTTVTLNKTWLGAAKCKLIVTGSLTLGVDYTLATSFGTAITSTSGDVILHPNADTTDLVITYLTNLNGRIELQITDSDVPDTGSTIGTTTEFHTVGVGVEVVLTATGTFQRSGTNQTISGVGFRPKLLILYSIGSSSINTVVSHAEVAMGFTDGTTSIAICGVMQDALATSNAASIIDTTNLLNCLSPSNPSVSTATCDLDTFNDDGFALTWGVPAGGVQCGYICIGGDITAEVGEFDSPIGAGTLNVSSSIADADMLIIGSILRTVKDSIRPDSLFGLGFATATDQGFISITSDDAQAATNAYRQQRTDNITSVINQGTGGVDELASFDGFTGSGFDLDYSAATAGQRNYVYAIIKGGYWEVGNSTTPTTNSTLSTTTTGLPQLLCLFGQNLTATTSVSDSAYFTFGATDGTNQGCLTLVDIDAADPTEAGSAIYNNKTYASMDDQTTTLEEGAFQAFNLTNFQIDFTKTTGTAREFVWFAGGDG